jgi:predicted DNA-binding protein (MmcQ/YjbR family)
VAGVSPAQRRSKHEAVHEFALGLPGAWEDHPWGETVVKVGKKVFVFLGMGEDGGGCSVKLRESQDQALAAPGAEPTGYGLGKAGWVTVPVDGVDEDVLHDWIEESYRLVAPKRLVAQLERDSRSSG